MADEITLEKRFGGADLKDEYTSFKKAKVVILPCPYEGTVTYKKGCSNGPDAILEASDHMELFDDELNTETYKIGIHTKTPPELKTLNPDEMVTKVKNEVTEILDSEKIPVLIGGEHSISIGSVWALSQRYKNNLSVLHLDAHYDLRNIYKGSNLNHACVARRFLEYCPVVQVGVRSMSKEEHDFLETNPATLKTISVYNIIETAIWKELGAKSLEDNVYISLDLDVLDPALMPAVGTPEPGGLGWYELLDFLKIVTKNKNVIGFDVVELAPLDNLTAPNFLAAKLIYRMLGYMFFNEKGERT